jgi:hypothetical protein
VLARPPCVERCLARGAEIVGGADTRLGPGNFRPDAGSQLSQVGW